MKYKRYYKQLCIIISSFLFYNHGKIEKVTNYKCTFGLQEGKSTNGTQKQMPSQRE
jgi:antitoxin component YwqK of YwqJK toxin-antitoxin module